MPPTQSYTKHYQDAFTDTLSLLRVPSPNDYYQCGYLSSVMLFVTLFPQHNVPFTDWFELEPVQSYHKSLPLEDFMEQLAPKKWPPGNRTGYCYRPSTFNKDSDVESCEMKYGNPFGPFWDEFNIDFDNSEFTRLTYSIEMEFVYKQWMDK